MPRWIWMGGFILSFLAGIMNVLSLIIFHHQAVSHVTGSIAQLGINIFSFGSGSVLHVVGIIFSFLIGATISGLIIRDAVLGFGKRYGINLMIESGFVFLGFIGFIYDWGYSDFLISAACGIQNAMATTYSGAVIRTTHMTGIVTDLGILFGHYLRGLPVSLLKLRLFLALLSGFVSGSIFGAFIYTEWSFYSFLIPTIILFLMGAFYTTFRLTIEYKENKLLKKLSE